MDSKANNFLLRYGRLIIYIAGIIVYFILLFMCISQVRQSNKLTTREISKNAIPEKLYFSIRADSLASNDTALITALNADIDSLNFKINSAIRLINTWNKQCDNNLLHGFDDLRQETNNIIEKQNGWFSFWTAILALVGGLLPVLIQMNTQKDQRHEFEEEKKKIQEAIKPLRSNFYYSEISKLSFTLIECSESILRIDDSERNKYCNNLLIRLHKMTGSFFATITENDSAKHSDRINDLKIVLIQLLAAYNACKVVMTQKHRLMNLDKVTTSIGEIIQELYDKNNIDNQKLTELLVQMESIHIA